MKQETMPARESGTARHNKYFFGLGTIGRDVFNLAGIGLRSFRVNARCDKLLSEKAMALVDFFGNCPAYIGQVQEIVAVHREKATVPQGCYCMAHTGL